MESARRKEPAALLNRVPEVTLYFRIIKIMATTVGRRRRIC